MRTYDPNHTEARRHFAKFSENHELTILHDDGLYRHLRVAQPGTGIYSWNIITWPGHLATSGDIANGYQFARLPDMFEFFRHPLQAGGEPYINDQYWAEKMPEVLQSRARVYSADLFRKTVEESASEWREELSPSERASLTAAIKRDILDEISDYEEADRALLDGFSWTAPSGQTFGFTDTWDYSFRDYDYHLILTLLAISKGIRMYDNAKTVTTVAEKAA
jgi:hypothetical protein